MVVFSLFILVAMLIVAGMGVDLVRYETQRTELQSTADRAVIAASSLNQRLDPELVVESYFAAAGLSDHLTSVDVSGHSMDRHIRAVADGTINTYFLKLVGIDQLEMQATSAAMESGSNLEIVLVLDVSGSMNSNNRLVNLKLAAADFVRTVLNPDDPSISIALVPFNGQVNLGPDIYSAYNVTDDPAMTNVNCVDLPASAYASGSIPTNMPLPATGYADLYSNTSLVNGFVNLATGGYAWQLNTWCPNIANNFMYPPTNNEDLLIQRINDLRAIGATSINAGLRWGTTYIDPEGRDALTDQIHMGLAPAEMLGRPYDYGDGTTKIVVMMSDGENFPEARLRPNFRKGPSPIYRDPTSGLYSVRVTGSGAPRYFVPHLGISQVDPFTTSGVAADAVQQSWVQVWQTFRMSYVAWQFYARAEGTDLTSMTTIYNNTLANMRQNTPVSAMNAQLQNLCQDLRDDGVTVYTIAFEAPINGQTQLSDCASSPNHFYNASGTQISEVFGSIANHLQVLRLIQ